MKTITKYLITAFILAAFILSTFESNAQKLNSLGTSGIGITVKNKNISCFGRIGMSGSLTIKEKIENTENQSVAEKKEEIPTLKISAYPNPFQSEFRLKFSEKTNFENFKPTVRIFDATGKIVNANFSDNFLEENGEIIINASNLKQGCYIIKVSLGKNNHSIKVIKL